MRTVLRALVAVGVLAATSFLAVPGASADGPIVTGGGSSFVGLLMDQWKADVANPPYKLSVNYSATGSGFGRERYMSGALDFGQSDIQFLPDEQGTLNGSGRKDFVYVPVAAGAVAFMFNVIGTNGQRITDLKLTQREACRIFTEPGIKWNDPGIVATNPNAPLPDRPIRPVVRDDRAGTSYVLSEFCIARAPDVWKKFQGTIGGGPFGQDQYLAQGKPISVWPRGFGSVSAAYSSDGIAKSVANGSTGADSITYIETGFKTITKLPVASVQNPAGAFTPPNPANSTVALAFASARGNGTFELSYGGTDPRAYFPSTYSYAIAQTAGFNAEKGKVLATFLNYAACQGQKRAEPLFYSRLSVPLVDIALDAIAKIPGAPPRPATASCNAPAQVQTQNAPAAVSAAPGAKTGAAATGATGATGGTAGPDTAAAGATDPAAAGAATDAAAAAAAADAAAAEQAAAAASGGGGATKAGTAGPENSDVVFTFLLGGALVALGTVIARGTRSGMTRS
jgi:phosphate transport system substrate-binding protein